LNAGKVTREIIENKLSPRKDGKSFREKKGLRGGLNVSSRKKKALDSMKNNNTTKIGKKIWKKKGEGRKKTSGKKR